MVMDSKDSEGMANSIGPDQTAPFRNSLIRIATVCPDLSVRILRIITVLT